MRTLIQGGDVLAFDEGGHRLLRDGAIVLEDDRVLFVGRRFPGVGGRAGGGGGGGGIPGGMEKGGPAGPPGGKRSFPSCSPL